MPIIKYAILPFIAILTITGLELHALNQGVNGICLSLSIGGITALATGGTIKLWKKFK